MTLPKGYNKCEPALAHLRMNFRAQQKTHSPCLAVGSGAVLGFASSSPPARETNACGCHHNQPRRTRILAGLKHRNTVVYRHFQFRFCQNSDANDQKSWVETGLTPGRTGVWHARIPLQPSLAGLVLDEPPSPGTPCRATFIRACRRLVTGPSPVRLWVALA